jgi:hypothetical protein
LLVVVYTLLYRSHGKVVFVARHRTDPQSLVGRVTGFGRYVEAGLQGAANTKRGYAADLRSFEDYCQHHQLGYLPAEVTTVAGYVSQLADRGKKYATIRRHVAAIAKLHQLAGQPSPTSHEALGVVLDGVARVHGKRQPFRSRNSNRPFGPWT